LLHTPTVLVLSFVLAATCGAILLGLWVQDRRHRAIASWGVGHLIGGMSLVLSALRPVLPGVLAIQGSNAVLAVSYGLIWAGARQFGGRSASPAVIGLGAMAWLAACQIPAFYGNIGARVLFMSLVATGYNLAAAWEFRRGRRENPVRSHPLIIGVLLANAAAYLLRIPFLLLQPIAAPVQGFPGTLWYDVLIILGTGLAVSTALMLVALVREREAQEAGAALRAARDAADRANAGKTRFLAQMSHELRTPLNGVLGLAQVLAQDPALTGEQRDRAAILEGAGHHLSALLNNVLDHSSIEAGRLEMVPVPTRLSALLDAVAGLTRAAADAKGVALRMDAAEDLPAGVLCDPLRVRQILHNLLGNAVKFTPPGGSVTLSVRWSDGGGLVLGVTDEGPGVPEEIRGRLFQDYTRGAREAAKGEGTGLGLAISAGLAQAMGGLIRFSTPPCGRGSLFEAWLPLAEAAPPPDAPLEIPPEAARLRVLVVDDLAVNRLVIRAMLEAAGHSVAEAPDGAAALAQIAMEPPHDVVLMDVLMPGMDGLETTRRIRALPGPAAGVRILAVSASALPEEVAACRAAGMDGFLDKPVDRRKLLLCLAEGGRAAA